MESIEEDDDQEDPFDINDSDIEENHAMEIDTFIIIKVF